MLILTIGSLWVKKPDTMCIGSWIEVEGWGLFFRASSLEPRPSCLFLGEEAGPGGVVPAPVK